MTKQSRVRRSHTIENLGLLHHGVKFYVNERLTKPNRILFCMASDHCRVLNWNAWAKNGRINVRRNDASILVAFLHCYCLNLINRYIFVVVSKSKNVINYLICIVKDFFPNCLCYKKY